MKLKPYIISLNDVSEKVKYLNGLDIHNIELVEGVRVKNISLEERKKALHPFFYQFMPDSVAGCAMAHMNVWKRFLDDEEHEYALVMEDDIILKPNKTIRDIYIALENTPSDFDILYLGCLWCNDKVRFLVNRLNVFKKYVNEEIINKTIKKPILVLGAHCYILSKKGARNLLELLYGNIFNHIDGHMDSVSEKIKRYSVIDIIASQTSINHESESENCTKSSHPIILHEIGKKIYLTDNLTCLYALKLKLVKVLNYELNLTSILCLVIGILASILNIRLEYLVIGFILLSLKDIIYDLKNEYMYIHFFLFIFPSICKKMITKN